MADPPLPLSVLLDPPLAPAPSIADLERRAHSIRRRRWTVRGLGGTVAVLAIAGLATLVTGTEPNAVVVRGAGDVPAAAVPGALSGAPAQVIVASFESGGEHWDVEASPGSTKSFCLAVVGAGSTPYPGACFDPPTASIDATLVAPTKAFTLLLGVTSNEVTSVHYDTGATTGDVQPVDIQFAVNFVTAVLPPGVGEVKLTAATASGNVVTLVVPPLGKAVPVPTVAEPPVAKTTPTLSVTAPPPTGPSTGDGAMRVTIVPGAVGLTKQPFVAASAADPSSVLLRFTGGVCGDVIGKVDVSETATSVTITLWTGYVPPRSTAPCPAIGVIKEILVQLQAPLGNRTVIDGAA